jgi:DNA polymerase IV
VVLAATYDAKACGVRTAMGCRQALRLCPDAVVVRPRMSAYSEASKAVFAVFDDTTPAVEALSIDEAFLDVRGMEHISGTPLEIARRLRHDVRQKVASAVAKPDGLLEVPAGGELAFLHPLPVERLWGVGQVTARKLRERGITTVGEVADLPETELVSILGRASGRHIHALAHNRDPRRVRPGRRRRSMGAQRALGLRSTRSFEFLDATLVALVDRLGRRLRAAQRVCRTVILRMRFEDFSRATRSHTMWDATQQTQTILSTARGLLAAVTPMIEARGITLLGVTLTNLEHEGAVQLALPFERQRAGALDVVLDDIRERFGTDAITRAVLIGRDPGITVPLLPD